MLTFFDVGGAIDDRVRSVEKPFPTARSELKHLRYCHFRNCLDAWVWRHNRRRLDQRIPTSEILRTFPADYNVVLVGGANEHWNDEPGIKWLSRVRETWRRSVWLNPQPEQWWAGYQSIQIVGRLLGGRMFPLTLAGLDAAIRELR